MNKDQLHQKKEFKSIRHIVEYAARTYSKGVMPYVLESYSKTRRERSQSSLSRAEADDKKELESFYYRIADWSESQ